MSLVTRRALLKAVPALALTSRCMALTPALDFATIERESGGKLGVFVLETKTGRTQAWRPDERFPFCSSFKAPLAAFVLWKTDHQELRLSDDVYYDAADLLPYAPVTRAHVAEGRLSVAELCAAAVQLSDNTAANLLLRQTGGPDALTAWMRSQGDPAFCLSDTEPKLNLARIGDIKNTTTPRAMAESYRRFVFGDVLTRTSRNKLASWLVANTTGDKRLRAGLPATWRIGDKTGTFNEGWFSTVDVGVAWPGSGSSLVIVGMLTDTPDTRRAENALAQVGHEAAAWHSGL